MYFRYKAIAVPEKANYLLIPDLGPIQVGATPESLKTQLRDGMTVSSTYICPAEMFDGINGVSRFDTEFRMFYNYFSRSDTLKGKIRIVCTSSQRKRIEIILQESFQGPDSNKIFLHDDYAQGMETHHPDFDNEFKSLRSGITIEQMVEFVEFDGSNNAVIPLAPEGSAVVITKLPEDNFRIVDSAHDIDKVLTMGKASRVSLVTNPEPFIPLVNDVDFIGTSDGYDMDGRTTGFLTWMNGKGVLIDPPVDAMKILASRGVDIQDIQDIILTHVHGDHDAGVLQMLVQAGLRGHSIRIHTTKTIMESFLRKSEAITGIEIKRLRKSIDFVRVRIGAKHNIHGANFDFRYNYHSIPTLGMKWEIGGKKIGYSGDTLHSAARLWALRNDKILPVDYGLVVDVPPGTTSVSINANTELLQFVADSAGKFLYDAEKHTLTVHGAVSFKFGDQEYTQLLSCYDNTAADEKNIDALRFLAEFSQPNRPELFTEERFNDLLHHPDDCDTYILDVGVEPLHSPIHSARKLIREKGADKVKLVHIATKRAQVADQANTRGAVSDVSIEGCRAKEGSFLNGGGGMAFSVSLWLAMNLERVIRNSMLRPILNAVLTAHPDLSDTIFDPVNIITIESGTRLITQGDKADYIYLVLSGTLCVSKSTDGGAEEYVAMVGSGALIGESILTNELRNANVTAISDGTRVLRIEKDKFIEAINHTSISNKLIRIRALHKQGVDRLVNLGFGDQISTNLVQLLSIATSRVIRPSKVIYRKDQIGKELFIVINGNVTITQSTKIPGKKGSKRLRTIIATRGKGELVGEMALFTPDHRRSADVRAGNHGATILEIKYKDFLSWIDNPLLVELFILARNRSSSQAGN